VTRSSIDFSQGEVMSVHKVSVLLVALASISFLAACGGGNGTSPVNPTPPATGGNFGNNDLNGTYVFSISGSDPNGAPYAVAGTLTANGSGSNCSSKGSVTAGTLDIASTDTSEFPDGPVARASFTGSYCIGVDGRGSATLSTNIGGGFPNLALDFVMQNSSHGLVIEFDTFGTGSGTLDLQGSNVTPSGPYAFLLSGATYSSATSFASAGNFTVGAGGSISAGAADFNNGAASTYPDETLTGTVAVSSTAPSTTFNTSTYPSLTFDVFPIDATHLKLIEMDATAVQSGDAFAQTTTTMPVGTLAFTLSGDLTGAAFAAGGFIVTDSTGDITSSSNEDFNKGGTLSPTSPQSFTGSYAVTTGNAGRYELSGLSGFTGGTEYAAYPSSGGVLLLEIDSSGTIEGITTGAAYTTTASASFAAPAPYGLNLSGIFSSDGSSTEVDDIAAFDSASSGTTITGSIDENSEQGPSTYGQPLDGTYTIIGGGRGQLLAPPSGSTTGLNTLNGGFSLIFYTVDGTTFPFMEYDTTQVSTGVFVAQSASSSASVAKPQAMYVPHPLFHGHSARQLKKQ
jgi:hypothetical protein